MKGIPSSGHLHTLNRIAEMRRSLSAIRTATDDQDHLTLMVTSGAKGEGKTTVASGIALAAAANRRHRVLLVDYNWYAPAIHTHFETELLDSPQTFYGADSLDNLIVSTPRGVDVLPAAKLDSAFQGAIIGSEGYDHHLIEEARHRYDTIVVDTSSAFPENQWMRDPVLLSSMVNGVILVCLTNITPRSTLKRTAVALKTHGANLLGVVANQWRNPIHA